MIPARLPFAASTFDQGLKAFRAQQYTEAEALLRQAMAESPESIEPRHVLALTLRAVGELEEATDLMQAVVESEPQNGEAWSNFGALLRETGHIEDSVIALRQAVKIDPSNPTALNNLGTALVDQGLAAEARTVTERALTLRPNYPDALVNLARIAFDEGLVEEAGRLARACVAIDPEHLEGHNRLSFVLASSGDVDGCFREITKARQLAPRNEGVQSNWFLRALSSDAVSSDQIREEAETWGQRFAMVAPLRKRQPGTLRKIGFISGDLRVHPVGHFVAPLLEHLSQSAEVVCYSTHPLVDAVSNRIQSVCSSWRLCHRTPTAHTAEIIANDEIDVLIDLSGHTGQNRLDVLAHRPAPIQVSWLGYSGTTGLPQMDWILADGHLIPEASEGLYSEKVARLPGTFLCADRSTYESVRPRAAKGPVFGVFNNPSKFSTTSYLLWATVLKTNPGSTILFKYHHSHDRFVQRQILARLCEHGVRPESVRFAPYVERSEHFEIVSGVSVALDTFPYSGATTTLDCVACGVPIVTLAGDRYASRMSASLLSASGFQNWVCDTALEYVETARALLQSPPNPQAVRDQFLAGPIFDAEAFARGWLDAVSSCLPQT